MVAYMYKPKEGITKKALTDYGKIQPVLKHKNELIANGSLDYFSKKW